jgi:hypothetical protein
MARKKRGGRRPGAGPKPKPATERRDKRVMLSLTPREFARLQRAAGRRPVAVFAREFLLARLR